MKHFTETGKYWKSSLSKKKIFFKKPTHSCIESLNYLYIILLNCNMLEIIKLFQILHWSISVTAMTYFRQSNWSISVAQMVFFSDIPSPRLKHNKTRLNRAKKILADLCFSIVYAFISHAYCRYQAYLMQRNSYHNFYLTIFMLYHIKKYFSL